jgi:hypothetical protein
MLSRSRICLAAEIAKIRLITAGHPRAPDASSCVGAGVPAASKA